MSPRRVGAFLAGELKKVETQQEQGALFDDSEILSGGKARALGERVKKRVDARRQSLWHTINRVVRTEVWAAAFRDWELLEERATSELQTRWNTAYSSGDPAQIISVLRAFESELLEFERTHQDAFVRAEHGLATQAAAELAAQLVVERLRPEMKVRFDAIDATQSRLDQTRKALEASKSFGEQVTQIRGRAGRAVMVWNAAILVLLAGGAYWELQLEFAAGTVWYSELFLRLSVLVPLSYVVYFFWGQYRLAQMTRIKYQHVEGLLSGGAQALVDLFQGREEFKQRLHERLADELLSVDGLMTAISRTGTPVEDAVKLIKSTTDAVAEVRKR